MSATDPFVPDIPTHPTLPSLGSRPDLDFGGTAPTDPASTFDMMTPIHYDQP